MISRDELLKIVDKLECDKLRDSHPDVQELIVDFFIENFTFKEK